MTTAYALENLDEFVIEYIYDEQGKKIAAVITMAALKEFLEEVEDLFEVRQLEEDLKNGAESIIHEEVMESLTRE